MTDEEEKALKDLSPAVMQTLAEVHDSFLQFLRHRLRNQSDGDDVMQEVYLRVMTHASEVRKAESVRIWLRRILRSALADFGRQTTARQRAEADFARKEAAIPPLIADLDAFVCMCLYKLLPLIKAEYAELLRRADLQNEPREAIAADLGLTLGNLTVRLHRARQVLRQALVLSCETCPIHGFLDCGCEYTKKLRSGSFSEEHSSPSHQV